MIILTKPQRDVFLSTKEIVKTDLLYNNVDYVPVEIKNGGYILPDEVLQDARFEKLKGMCEFDKYEKKELTKNELIITGP